MHRDSWLHVLGFLSLVDGAHLRSVSRQLRGMLGLVLDLCNSPKALPCSAFASDHARLLLGVHLLISNVTPNWRELQMPRLEHLQVSFVHQGVSLVLLEACRLPFTQLKTLRVKSCPHTLRGLESLEALPNLIEFEFEAVACHPMAVTTSLRLERLAAQAPGLRRLKLIECCGVTWDLSVFTSLTHVHIVGLTLESLVLPAKLRVLRLSCSKLACLSQAPGAEPIHTAQLEWCMSLWHLPVRVLSLSVEGSPATNVGLSEVHTLRWHPWDPPTRLPSSLPVSLTNLDLRVVTHGVDDALARLLLAHSFVFLRIAMRCGQQTDVRWMRNLRAQTLELCLVADSHESVVMMPSWDGNLVSLATSANAGCTDLRAFGACTRLKELHLTNWRQLVSCDGLVSRSLTSLHLQVCPNLRDLSALRLCTGLRTVVFQDCECLDAASRPANSLCRLPYLQALRFRGCKDFEFDTCFGEVWPSLQRVTLGSDRLTDDNLLATFGEARGLEHIELFGCTQVTSARFLHPHIHRLRTFRMFNDVVQRLDLPRLPLSTPLLTWPLS